MKFAYSILLLLVVAALFSIAPARAADSLVAKRIPPKVVLVELFSQQSRMDALIRAKRYRDTATLSKDARKAVSVTVKDFKDNFQYCRYYFFWDKDFDAIMAGQFDGVLLDSSLSLAKNVNISDTNYLIVHYGIPQWQSHKRKMEVTNKTEMGGKPNGYGLIMCNYQMKQIGYTYWLRNFLVSFKKKGKVHDDYIYVSKKFDIEYYPLAGNVSDKLIDYRESYKQNPFRSSGKKSYF